MKSILLIFLIISIEGETSTYNPYGGEESIEPFYEVFANRLKAQKSTYSFQQIRVFIDEYKKLVIFKQKNNIYTIELGDKISALKLPKSVSKTQNTLIPLELITQEFPDGNTYVVAIKVKSSDAVFLTRKGLDPFSTPSTFKIYYPRIKKVKSNIWVDRTLGILIKTKDNKITAVILSSEDVIDYIIKGLL